MKITLLYGGRSAEHEVSILSAFSVLNAIYYNYYQVQLVFITKEGQWVKGPLLTEKPASKDVLHLSWDPSGQTEEGFTGKVINPGEIKEEGAIVFPVLHGPNGEDGTIQGFLETLNMPYVGAGVLTSACAMDKIMTKYILQAAGVPQVPYVPVLKNQWKENPKKVFDQCEGSLLYPMFVKPANMGSSVGITKAENREELQNALATAYQYDSRAIVEQGIEAREIEVYQKAQEYAKLAYTMLGGSGLSRCDFFLTNKNELFLNELNSMPGFTEFSMYPLLWENMGLKYGDLIEELIQLGMNRYHQRQSFFEKNE